MNTAREPQVEQHEVYVLHFDRPYWKFSRHYVGYTSKGTLERTRVHRAGKGSQLVRYALDKGIDFVIGRIIPGFQSKLTARNYEIRLKKEGHLDRHCTICIENKRRARELLEGGNGDETHLEVGQNHKKLHPSLQRRLWSQSVPNPS